MGAAFLPIWFITESRVDTWIIAQDSMSNANVSGRFRCNKEVEKHCARISADDGEKRSLVLRCSQ